MGTFLEPTLNKEQQRLGKLEENGIGQFND